MYMNIWDPSPGAVRLPKGGQYNQALPNQIVILCDSFQTLTNEKWHGKKTTISLYTHMYIYIHVYINKSLYIRM